MPKSHLNKGPTNLVEVVAGESRARNPPGYKGVAGWYPGPLLYDQLEGGCTQ